MEVFEPQINPQRRRRVQDPKTAFLSLVDEIEASFGQTLEGVSKGVERLLSLVDSQAYIRSEEVSKSLKDMWASSERSSADAARTVAKSIFAKAREFANVKL